MIEFLIQKRNFMNALILVLFAACSAAICNLFFRKNSAENKAPLGQLTCHYFISFISSLFICYDIWYTPFDITMTLVGSAVGVLNVFLMILTISALKRGSSGLTFAFQNAGSVLPGLLLFLLFGASFGFAFTYAQAIGIVLVLVGLFLGAKTAEKNQEGSNTSSWLKFATACFLVQVCCLTLIQWRCLIFQENIPAHSLIPARVSEQFDIWFLPGFFGTASLFQLMLFLREKRWLKRSEIVYGIYTGVANGISMYLLGLATKLATPLEKAILFPCFAVTVIILCNAWACKLYNEKFQLWPNLACILGIVIGSIA